MVKLYKLTGAGNNFLLIDLRDRNLRKSATQHFRGLSRKKIARELCNPHQSIGADGLLFLEHSSRADLKWDFYNADGSPAEMCGNAARCVGRYLIHQNVSSRYFTLDTKAGLVGIFLPLKMKYKFNEPALIEIEMPKVKIFQANQKIKMNKKSLNFNFIDTGVPHAVVELPAKMSINSLIKNVDKLGNIVNKIRAQSRFKKHGTNVTFYSKKSKSSIVSLTFERGVSGYTQACGTGAVAAAVSLAHNKSATIQVRVPGGLLIISLQSERPHLIGLGEMVAEIIIR